MRFETEAGDKTEHHWKFARAHRGVQVQSREKHRVEMMHSSTLDIAASNATHSPYNIFKFLKLND